jgi:transcription elongation factor Elf1
MRVAQKAKKEKTTRKTVRTPRKTVKVTFATYVSDGSDGSVFCHLFKNEKLAERQGEADLKSCGQRFEGDVSSFEIEVDVETGEVVSGVETKVDK